MPYMLVWLVCIALNVWVILRNPKSPTTLFNLLCIAFIVYFMISYGK